MSIFDDLSKDSFFSRKATNKQTGGSARNKADVEAASDMTVRKKTDAEVASEFSAKKHEGGKESKGETSRNQTDREIASDIFARNQTGASGAPGMASGSMAGRDDAEFASDFDDNPNTGAVTDKKTAGTENTGVTGDTGMVDTGAGSDVTMKGKDTDAEFASDMAGFNRYSTQNYTHAGVTFSKLSEGEAKINYSGLLSQEGANEVIGVYGYGSNQNWENVSSVTLRKDPSGDFTATIPIVSGKNVNLAFKDTAENWDNNSGLNYTFVN
jgi:hypothetical protein